MPFDAGGSVGEMRTRLEKQERLQGPYSPTLVPALRSLGASFFEGQQFGDAIDTYGKAIHLLRVNEGLGTLSQAGLVEQVIEAQIEVENYIAADNQQAYLFQIRSANLPPGSPEMRVSVEQYADWHRTAYLAELDRYRYPRIVALIDLYSEMMSAVASANEGFDRTTLPYLEGKLKTQYMLSIYPGETEVGLQAGAKQKDEVDLPDLTKMRFKRFQDNNYRYGHQTIQQLRAVIANDSTAAPRDLAEVQVALGDWYQWHSRYSQAIRTYSEAWAMMAEQPGGADWLRATFEDPLELPSQVVFQPGRMPLRTSRETEVKLRFTVSRHGEAKGIEILFPEREENQPAVTRAYKYLRDMRFRPRLRNGKIVAANDVERTYNIRY